MKKLLILGVLVLGAGIVAAGPHGPHRKEKNCGVNLAASIVNLVAAVFNPRTAPPPPPPVKTVVVHQPAPPPPVKTVVVHQPAPPPVKKVVVRQPAPVKPQAHPAPGRGGARAPQRGYHAPARHR